MVGIRDQHCYRFHSHVHGARLLLREQGSTDESFTDVCNCLITKQVFEYFFPCLRVTFAFEKLQPLRIPRTSIEYQFHYTVFVRLDDIPREALTAYILVQLEFYGGIEQILVANQKHPLHVILKFVVVRILSKKGNRGSHLEKTVSHEFKPFVILAHATLKVYLLVPMLFGIIRVFGKSFEGEFRFDIKMQCLTGLECDKVRFQTKYDGRENEAHSSYTCGKLRHG